MFGQITGLVATVFGMGLGNSGVRQVFEAVAEGNNEKTGYTVLALRRTIWISGLLGLLFSIAFCVPISQVTFGHDHYARRISIVTRHVAWMSSLVDARHLVMLGLSFMGAGLITTLTGYLIQMVLIREYTLGGAGLYQSAFALSGILVDFVLSAMGTDYYPRLTAVASDNASVHRMVNVQSQISILLSLPGLVVMMIFAPLIIKIFYAASFAIAVPILRWCILGILGRVFSWPMGFVMLAKGKNFLITEIIGCVVHMAAVLCFIRVWGLVGAGIAFMVSYVIYSCVMIFVMHKMVGAAWDRHTLKLALVASIIMVLLMLNCNFNENICLVWAVNMLLLAGVVWFCFNRISKQSDISMQLLLVKLRLIKG
jgi:PST family polysaccharide transporter